MAEPLPPRMEFTGERIVPGLVEPDLFHEHMARYAFARRLARRKRVLDAGCGAGYGSAALAGQAAFVAAVDISREAVEEAARQYPLPNLAFLVARAEQMPFRSGSFDLVVAFEVIEHLEDWRALLSEARRLLAPGGQFIVSTPNRLYYAESRAQSGPNPYHVHEFDYGEFRAALSEFFPSTAIYLQNHSGAITFLPVVAGAAAAAELAPDHAPPDPASSHFFLAVCAAEPQTGAPLYVYLPSTGNVLREREEHIRKLKNELRQKDQWLEELKQAHATLHAEHEKTLAEMKAQAEKALAEIGRLEREIETQRRTAEAAVEAYEAQIRELNTTLETLAAQHRAKLDELAECVRLLDDAERRVVERTEWAQRLDARARQLEQTLAAVRASRWVRLGRKLGVGPQLE
ncbi:MAG: methyltransferase domain-containing protein [Bryobacteraceae bacterium]